MFCFLFDCFRRLEHQMRVQQLKLREEKRIVTEIDALKRSRKLIQYVWLAMAYSNYKIFKILQRSDWLVTKSYQSTDTLSICSHKNSKILYIKCPLVSIYSDINTLQAVEHSISQRNTQLCLKYLYDFFLVLTAPSL